MSRSAGSSSRTVSETNEGGFLHATVEKPSLFLEVLQVVQRLQSVWSSTFASAAFFLIDSMPFSAAAFVL